MNGVKVKKPGHGVIIGDVLTFVQAKEVRVVRVTALGVRRGPASEASALFDDLDPQTPDAAASPLE